MSMKYLPLVRTASYRQPQLIQVVYEFFVCRLWVLGVIDSTNRPTFWVLDEPFNYWWSIPTRSVILKIFVKFPFLRHCCIGRSLRIFLGMVRKKILNLKVSMVLNNIVKSHHWCYLHCILLRFSKDI